MKYLRVVVLACALLALALALLSCGGGPLLGGSSAGQQSRPAGVGSITITVHWPESSARIVPAGTDRVVVQIFQEGSPVANPSLPLAMVRDEAGGVRSVVINDLPVGDLTVTVEAFSDDDLTRPLASATNVPVTLQPGMNAPVIFTLSSAVAMTELVPESAAFGVGESQEFTALALDDQSAVIVGIEFAFAAVGGNYFTVTPQSGSDNVATVTGTAGGEGAALKAWPANDPDPAHAALAPITCYAPEWWVATLAGADYAELPLVGARQYDECWADGPVYEALFCYPIGVDTDALGNVYVADQENHVIRKITPGGESPASVLDKVGLRMLPPTFNGTVQTIAGCPGDPGFEDGDALDEALFSYPTGIEVDDLGNVYVADAGNCAIRMISGGVVTTLAGTGEWGFRDGYGWEAMFDWPTDVTVAPDGTVFVCDMDNCAIRAILPEGVYPPGAPRRMTRQGSDRYVVTIANPYGWYGYWDGPGFEAEFACPAGIALNNQTGVIYVADYDNHVIRQLTPNDEYWPWYDVTTLAGGFGSGGYYGGRQPGPPPAKSREGRQRLAGGVSVRENGWGGGYADGPADLALFYYPEDVDVDSEGNVFVVEDNERVRKITLSGDQATVTTVAGSGRSGHRDGPALEADFWWPLGVCVDQNGMIYVGDSSNNRIRLVWQKEYTDVLPEPTPTPTPWD